MTTTLANISVKELQQALTIREKIESLQAELDHVLGDSQPAAAGRAGKRHVSASARARMAKAQRARWAELKVNAAGGKASKPRRKMSAAAKARLSAAAKQRWKAAKAAGKSRL